MPLRVPEQELHTCTLVPSSIFESILRQMKQLAVDIEQGNRASGSMTNAGRAQQLLQLITELEMAPSKIVPKRGELRVVPDDSIPAELDGEIL